MNWLKRKLEIRRLKKLEREKLWEMMRADYLCNIVRERELEHEVDEIRARIAGLRGDAEFNETINEKTGKPFDYAKLAERLRG